MQNKSIRFLLRLDKMQDISLTEFRSINWLPIKETVHQCINAITFKFVNKNCPFYLNEIFELLRTVEWTQEIVLQSLSTIFARLTRDRKPYHTLVLLFRKIYPKPLKNE